MSLPTKTTFHASGVLSSLKPFQSCWARYSTTASSSHLQSCAATQSPLPQNVEQQYSPCFPKTFTAVHAELDAVSGNIVTSVSSLSFEGFIHAKPRGVYSGLRTFGGKKILDWSGHMHRITKSLNTLREPTTDRLSPFFYPETLSKIIKPLAIAALDKSIESNLWMEKSACHNRKLCILVHGAASFPTFHVHVSRLLAPSSNCSVSFGGLPRKNPSAKDSLWVTERKKLNCGYGSLVDETLLHDASGNLYEGASSNFFVVKNGTVFTAPLDSVLEGTILKMVLEVCLREKIPIKFEFPNKNDVHNWEGCFITSTSRLVLPIQKIFFSPHRYSSINQSKLTLKISSLVEKLLWERLESFS